MAALTIILIAAFAIDRLVNGLFFLLSFSDDLRPLVSEDPAHPDEGAARTRRLIYGLVAGYLGVVVVAGILKVRLFEIIQFTPAPDGKPNAMLDTLLTGLILAGGADRLSELVKSFSGEGKKGGEKPIEITGKLVLEQPAAAKSHSV